MSEVLAAMHINTFMQKNIDKITYTSALFYITIATGVYFNFFYRIDAAIVTIVTILFILFLPILFHLIEENVRLSQINILLISGFCIGFLFTTFLTDNSVWAITLVIWLLLSIPVILILNLMCLFIKKRKERKTNQYTKINSILTGIIENSLFIIVFTVIGEIILKDYDNLLDPYEFYVTAFTLLFVPLLNLLFANFKALLGNIIGIPVFMVAFMILSALVGYKG